MQSALKRRWGLAFKNVGGFIAADIFVLSCTAILFLLLGLSGEGFWLRIASSIFLVAYGLRLFFSTARESKATRNFWLTFLNPGIWMANFSLLAIWGESFNANFLLYALGIQLGSLLWYSLMIFAFPYLGTWGDLFVKRVAPILLMITGVWIGLA
jgi:hypothetical protein